MVNRWVVHPPLKRRIVTTCAAYDFLTAWTHDGRVLRDPGGRPGNTPRAPSLAMIVARRSRALEVLETLADLFLTHGVPAYLRSERHACRLLGQWRGTQRYRPTHRPDEEALTCAVVALASQYGRYGYRRVTALLGTAGWHVGKDRVARIWRREGLKVPQRQKPRRRWWLNDGSCGRLRPLQANHVWSCDFVSTRTHDGRTVRLLTLIDEYTRECLAIRVARRLGSDEVIDVLADVMVTRGIPDPVRSDNGPEFIALRLRQWLADVGAQTLYIEPGSPWENGYCESFNSKLRDEFLNGEIFSSLKEAQILTERWRVHYNTVRPHSSLGHRHRMAISPAPLAMPPPSESRSVPSAVM